MSRAARLAAAMLLAGFAAPLLAQAQADPVRLDDFAVTRSPDEVSHVDQLAPTDDRIGAAPQPHDRSTAGDQPMPPPTAALPQLSASGQRSEPTQLSKAGASPDESSAAVSSPEQSRPAGVVRIGGRDRCDPQLARAELERCQRILELRAQEFHAPAPPQLSAEQQLLAAQQSDDDRTAARSTGTRLRLASRDDPDADLQSNQELAALYLDKPASPPAGAVTPEDQQAAATDAALTQILSALQVQSSGAATTTH